MAKKISNKILIGLTGEKPDDLLLKIREANGFGLKEASLFLELIEIAKRDIIYNTLLKLKIIRWFIYGTIWKKLNWNF